MKEKNEKGDSFLEGILVFATEKKIISKISILDKS